MTVAACGSVVWLSFRERISETTGPNFTEFFVHDSGYFYGGV